MLRWDDCTLCCATHRVRRVLLVQGTSCAVIGSGRWQWVCFLREAADVCVACFGHQLEFGGQAAVDTPVDLHLHSADLTVAPHVAATPMFAPKHGTPWKHIFPVCVAQPQDSMTEF